MTKPPLVQIGSLASSEKGAFKIGPFGSSLKKTELVSHGIPVAGIENILPNRFEKGFRRFITTSKFMELSDYEIRPGDVLVTTMGTIGRAAVAPVGLSQSIIDSHLFRMRFDIDRVYPPYLAYALNSGFVAEQLGRTARGAIMDGLNTTILRECVVPLPSLFEQKRIARQLEQADRLRRTRRYTLELSDSFLPAAFLELFGDPVKNPHNWPLTTLGELVRDGDKLNYGVVQPGNDLTEGVPIIRVADLDDLETSSRTLKRIAPEIEEKHSASRLVGDELLIGCVGSIGKIAKATPRVGGCNIARAVARVRGNWSRINRDFLEHYLRSSRAQDFFINETRTSSQPTLNITQIEETPVIEPPLAVQQKFAAIVERHEHLRATQREALRQAEHLFQTLLHRAFNEGA